ncbi:interferon-induced protein 44-like [Mercenaria mercenaria]|uniref:interferon-induced protein 44-like n=1 Tax=Mercenaria mercenaria TaxID=6596 RepID=UPI00234F75AD|nr:interferon-induced protein 44-like [Mercenaria mercenaria]
MFRYFLKEFIRSPWREPGPSEWNESMYDDLCEEIGKISFNEEGRKCGILLCGPNQSGRSSFVNTVISICIGRPAYVTRAMFSEEIVTYHHLRLAAYGRLNNFMITDTKGLLEPKGRGLNVDDVLNSLRGNIKNGYKFEDDPIDRENEYFYNASPSKEDESHCLVFIVGVNSLETFPEKYLNKIKEIVRNMQENRYPMVLILTKMDQYYPYLQRDIRYMFKSSIVHEAVLKASKIFGIQERDIHPVVNFTKEIRLNKIKSIPVLLALRQILYYAQDRIHASN